ncbi:hypothetical protein ACIQV3_22575 [Streptomyces sp. NPDC099050]|uniref:hypothetical protein n=1 Tax=Streptomyces sp. NPDC099050 TaxID=3366100 RepID=UPI00382C878B
MAQQKLTVVIPATRTERLASLEHKYQLGQLLDLTLPNLLQAAADLAADTTLPAATLVDDRIARMFIRRASSNAAAQQREAARRAEARRDSLLFAAQSPARHELLNKAEQKLATARTRAVVAAEQVDYLIEEAVAEVEPLLPGIAIGDLPGLLRLVAAELAAHAASSHVRRPAMT